MRVEVLQDPNTVLARMMRHLAAMAVVREVGPDMYTHSNFTRLLAGGPLQDAIEFMYGPVPIVHP